MAPVLSRPRIHLNCAVSLDGRLAFADGARARLSGPEDLERVHRLRAESDAILVGVNTVRKDDPSLRVRWELLGTPPGRLPMRVVLDTHGRLPPDARVLDGSAPTLVATGLRCTRDYPPAVATFRAGGDAVDLPALLAELGRRGVRSVLVEGGAKVLASFLRGGLVDRFTVYIAPVVIGGATAPPMVGGPESHSAEETVALERVAVQPLGEGVLMEFRLARPAGPAL